MNKQKIAFIICTNNALYYEECVRYINELEVPVGYCTDIICIQEANSMAEGYNAGMQEILAPHRPEMSWRWRRHLPEKNLQKWGYDF